MRGANQITLQPPQILRLPHKMKVISDLRHIWNVISNARSKQSHPPTSPNTAPATKFWMQDCSAKTLNCFRQYKDDSRIIRRYPRIIRRYPRISEDKIVISHPPLRRPSPCDLGDNFVLKNTTFRAPAISQNVTKRCACHGKSHSTFTKYCACHEKSSGTVTLLNCDSTELWLYMNCDSTDLWLFAYETSFPVRRANQITLQPPQILRLPHKMKVISDLRHIWNVISNARSKQSHPPTSPNTAPATKFWMQDFSAKTLNCFRQYKDDSRIIRRYPRIIRRYPRISEDKIVISHPPLRRPSPCDLGDNFVLKNTTFRAPAISQNVTKCCACHGKSHSTFTKYCACHEKSSGTVTLLNCDSTELWLYWTATLLNCYSTELWLYWTVTLLNCYSTEIQGIRIWNIISSAQSKSNHPPTSPNTAPATQNEGHQRSATHMKRHFQCAEQTKSPSNLTKYCACHEILNAGFQRKNPELLPPI